MNDEGGRREARGQANLSPYRIPAPRPSDDLNSVRPEIQPATAAFILLLVAGLILAFQRESAPAADFSYSEGAAVIMYAPAHAPPARCARRRH